MTVETSTEPNEPKIVASLIKSAYKKPIIANSFSLVAGTYSKMSSLVKPVCPSSVSTRWEAAETYLADNNDAFVASADEFIAVASKFVNDVNEARAKNQATEFILTTVEDLVNEEIVNRAEGDDEEPKPTTTRIYGITGAVSKTFYKKATSGLENLNKRTTDVVHVDLMKYANNFIDGSVKPQYDYVAGLPTAVSDKFSVYAEPVKAKAMAGFDIVQLAMKDTLIEPAMNAYNMKCKEGKGMAEVATYLSNTTRVSWNDKFVVPVAAYLKVPNLHYSTLKPLILDFANNNYAATFDQAKSKYNTVCDYGSEKYTAVSKSIFTFLDNFTTSPIAELNYVEIPASVYCKVTSEFNDRYLEFTGKEFEVKTAPVVISFLVVDYLKPFLSAFVTKTE